MQAAPNDASSLAPSRSYSGPATKETQAKAARKGSIPTPASSGE